MKIDNFGGGEIGRSDNLGGETSFTIENSPFAFKILSESLYSHKIQSVIRELSTNAADEHVSSGKGDIPFDVHVPTGFEPYFSIRDYGAGLSEADATTLYTTFFKSTKRNDNAVTGCLGLGSKSPFAVTDSFTIESFNGGIRTVYTCFKDENFFPKLVVLERGESSEPTGVRIQFPVSGSHWDWKYEAARVYKFFAVKPNLNFEISGTVLPAPLLRGNGWAMYEDMHESYAVMGNVAYPIDFSAFKSDDELQKDIIGDFRGMTGFVFEFPLGAVSFDPSRERLTYNVATKDAIFAALVALREEFKRSIESSVSEASNLFEARMKYAKVTNDLLKHFDKRRKNGIGWMISDMVCKWNGRDLFPTTLGHVVSLASVSGGVMHASKSPRRQAVNINVFPDLSFDFDRPTDIYVIGKKTKSVRRRARMKVLENNDPIMLVNHEAADTMAQVLGADDASVFKSADDLPQVPQGVSPSSSRSRVVATDLDRSGRSFNLYDLNAVDKAQLSDLEGEDAMYVIRNNDSLELESSVDWGLPELQGTNYRYLTKTTFHQMLHIADKAGFAMPKTLVILNRSTAASVRIADRGFPNILTEMVDFFSAHLSGKGFAELMEDSRVEYSYVDGEGVSDWEVNDSAARNMDRLLSVVGKLEVSNYLTGTDAEPNPAREFADFRERCAKDESTVSWRIMELNVLDGDLMTKRKLFQTATDPHCKNVVDDLRGLLNRKVETNAHRKFGFVAANKDTVTAALNHLHSAGLLEGLHVRELPVAEFNIISPSGMMTGGNPNSRWR